MMTARKKIVYYADGTVAARCDSSERAIYVAQQANAHDSLVDALRECESYLSAYCPFAGDTLNKARAALAQVSK